MQVTFVKAVEGKFGPQLLDRENKYYSFGKFYKGPTDFTGTAEVDLFVTAKGNNYINKLIPVGTDEPKKRGRPTKEITVPSVEVPVKLDPRLPVVVGRDYEKENYGKIKTLFLQAVMPQLINGVMQDDELKAVIKKWALYSLEDDR
jgi:hypothetical protein